MSPASTPPFLARFPASISHWLGYRSSKPPKRPEYVVWISSWIAAFCGLSVIMAVFGQAHYFIERKVPLLVASYAASAVLIYGAIDAPLAQPRALLGGHFIGGLIGVCVAKLFHLSPRFEELRWLSGSISCATAIVAMQITGTTHPPAGATAILPSIEDDVAALGWYYLPVILLSSALALAVALLVNNVARHYPVYWITLAASPHAPVDGVLVVAEKDGALASGASSVARMEVEEPVSRV